MFIGKLARFVTGAGSVSRTPTISQTTFYAEDRIKPESRNDDGAPAPLQPVGPYVKRRIPAGSSVWFDPSNNPMDPRRKWECANEFGA